MSSPVSLELSQKITEWRRLAAEGSLTIDDQREIIKHLRAGRVAAANASAASKRKKAITEIPHANDMLSELEGL